MKTAPTPPTGAAHNPFRSERVTSLPFISQGVAWEESLQKLEALSWRGAIVGPCGTGKTTLLEKLALELESRGLKVDCIRFEPSPRPWPKTLWKLREASDALLIDGIDQLPPLAWWRLQNRTRRAGALVATSHREGRLATWLKTSTSPSLLKRLCTDLGAEISDAEIARVFEANQGNLRLCLLEFYDRARRSP